MSIMFRNISLYTVITRLLSYLQDFYYLVTEEAHQNKYSKNAAIFSLNGDDTLWVINYKYLGIYLDTKL